MPLPSCLSPLTTTPRWVGWRWTPRPNGDMTKPLFRCAHPDFHAKSDDPRSWCGFALASATFNAGRVDGVGYVTTQDEEHVFIDLDDCRNAVTGEIADWAQEYVEQANSYTEITPSKEGLRIIGLRGHLARSIHTGYKLPSGGHGEIFFRATRYVTVTGDQLPGTPNILRDIADVTLDLLMAAGKMTGGTIGQPEDYQANPEKEAPLPDVAEALAIIPNPDLPYDDWVKVGLAVYASAAGVQDGFDLWETWSKKSAKHDAAECIRVWSSFHKSPPKRIGYGSLHYMARQSQPDFRPSSWPPEAEPILKMGKGTRSPFEEQADPQQEPPDPAKPLLPLIYFNDFEPNLDVADFVEDLLTEGSMSVVYGESNAGKTFVVTDICCHVATGTVWRERAIEAGGVIYCALEGKHGIGNRIAAFKKAHGLEGVEVPFAVVPVAINLLDPDADRSKLVQTIQVAAEAMGCPVKMVVIDTLSRALAGGNENDSEDMGALVASADYIRQAVNAHILFIHHSGKDVAKGARGHSLLRAATDTEIEISRPDDAAIGTIKVTKQRDMAKAADMHFSLKVVELGTNRRGKEVTSCVVEAIEPDQAPAARPKRAKLSAGAQVALDCLIRVLGTHGEHRRGLTNVPSTVKSVTEIEWRRAYYATSSAPSDKARQMAFARAQEALAASKIALLVDSFAWVVTA